MINDESLNLKPKNMAVVFCFSKAERNRKPREGDKGKEGAGEERRALDTKEKPGLRHERQTT